MTMKEEAARACEALRKDDTGTGEVLGYNRAVRDCAAAVRQCGNTSEENGAGDLTEKVRAAMKRAYNLGQTYWQQADSEYVSQNKKADVTAGRFIELNDELCAAIASYLAQQTDEQLRDTAGYKLGWMEGMQEGAELATGGEKTAADVEAEFADLLPGSYYMDPPDGGSPSVLEQVSRMAEDAAQWRAHLARQPKAEQPVIKTWQERMGPGYIDGGMDLPEEVAMKAEIADLRAHIARQAQAKPVEYQGRMRPMWRPDGEGWTEWAKISRGTYDDYIRVPINADWQFEARALHSAPVAPASAQNVQPVLQDWLKIIHDNELTQGDRLQRISCRIQEVLSATRIVAKAGAQNAEAIRNQWISVDERLPECSKKPGSLGVEVIVYPQPEKGESTAFFGCRLTNEPDFYKYGSRVSGVTHWMPLPGAPSQSGTATTKEGGDK